MRPESDHERGTWICDEGSRGWSFLVGEDVLKQEPEALRRFLFWEDLANRGEHVVYRVQVKYMDELSDVLRVAGPGCECFHREQVLR